MAIGLGVNIQKQPNKAPTGALGEAIVNGSYPKLLLDFNDDYYATNGGKKLLGEALTHSRAGNATMVDSDGLLKWAPHNLVINSEDFTQWTNSNSSDSANETTAPDGNLTADRLIDNTSNAGHTVYQVLSPATGTVYTFTCYLKAGELNYGTLALGTDSGISTRYLVNIDLSTGTVTDTHEKGTPSGIGYANPVDVGNGWYRCSVSMLHSSSSLYAIIGTNNSSTVTASVAGDAAYVGDGSSGIYLWGAHLYRSDLGGMVDVPAGERAFPSASTYVPTTSSARYLPRVGHHVYNGSAWVNEGLLHESEARTNAITYSEDFSQWTQARTSVSSGITSPDGNATAYSFLDTADNNNHTTYLPLGAVSASWTLSVFVKQKDAGRYIQLRPYGLGSGVAWATFDPSDGSVYESGGTALESADSQSIGNGWFRVSITCSSALTGSGDGVSLVITDGTTGEVPTYVGDGSGVYIYGAQLEASPTPSSYIPTAGATVTRAAETLTIPSANLPWPTPQVIGDELVTDGGFDAGTVPAGWSGYAGSAASATLSIVDNTLRVTRTGSTAGFSQYTLTGLTAGKVYQFQADILDNVAALFGGSTASFDTSPEFGEAAYSVNQGTRSFVWTATTTTAYLIVATPASSVDVDNVSVREINPLSVSIQMDGRIDYSDQGEIFQSVFLDWTEDADNGIKLFLNAAGAEVSEFRARQEASGVVDDADSTATTITPGILVPFNIASRHGSTFINGAVDGVALTANTTPTALPDLSSTDLNLGYDYMGTIKTFRIWDKDLGDTGIEEATAPSLEPSLELVFDGSESSFVVLDWEQ